MALRVSNEGRRVGSADMIQRQKEKGEEQTRGRGEGATEGDGARLEGMRREDTARGRDGGAGNQINDLTQKDFEVYEDNAVQDIAGFYREGQIPLRLIFLFDISGSIRHRFDFEQRAAAQFFRNVMHNGDQAALMSVSSESKIELQFTSDVDQLVEAL